MKAIEKAMKATTLSELAQGLRMVIQYAEEQGTNDIFMALREQLNSAMLVISLGNMPRGLNDLFASREAVLIYLDSRWEFCPTSYAKNIEECGRIIEFVQANVVPPRGERVSEDEIRDIMSINIVERTFTSDFENLTFLLVDESFAEANAYYMATGLETGRRRDLVFVPHALHGFRCPQTYSILHELGHVFHIRVTENLNEVPPGFENILWDIFPGSLSAPREAMWEIFADCFASAMTVKTVYEKIDPMVTEGFDKKKRRAIHRCILGLIKEYEEDR